MNKVFVGGYWAARAESISSVARSITLFLNELRQLSEVFSALKLTARSKRKAMENVLVVTEEEIQTQLARRCRKDEIDANGYCEVGFSLLLFDYIDENLTVEVSFTIGSYSKLLSNVCFVKIKGEFPEKGIRNKLLSLIGKYFYPDTTKVD